MMVRVDTADRRWLRSWRWTKGSAFSSTASSPCAGGRCRGRQRDPQRDRRACARLPDHDQEAPRPTAGVGL